MAEYLKVGSWSEINSAFKTLGSPTNKCPTEAEIKSHGLTLKAEHASSNALPPFSFIMKSTTSNAYTFYSPTSSQLGTNGLQFNAASRLSVSGQFVTGTVSGGNLLIVGRGTYTAIIAYDAKVISGISYTYASGKASDVFDYTSMSFSPTSDSTYEYSFKRIII